MINWKLEDLYLTIFDSAVVAIGLTDTEGKYVMVNPAWCSMMGYTAEEAKRLHVNDVTPPEDRQSSKANYDRLISGELPGIRLSRRYVKKDGTYFWADLHVSRVTDREGQAAGLVGIFVDIDPQKQAEADLRDLNSKLSLSNQELQQAMEELRRLARHDSLTQLLNRRVLTEILDKEIQRSSRSKRGLAVAMADVDNFKKINDQYGHDVGDVALIELAKVLKEQIRTTDYVGRWGGEEFLFVFPETTCKGAMIVIERVREQVAKIRIPVPDGDFSFTVSIGLSYHMGIDTGETIVQEADQAMYAAKQAGKNRCIHYQPECLDV
ncbi:MAG: diguanylate cyclase [Candidatus Cloacimonetes bacterium]|jgi:diguanylate cyclase (GGDEF)-like protein/PAS domain S-box-containing protein|nr:diguanylate cyclase [Candidatus Cloacimonadota bacterium]MDD2506287.1 diguanylate cyclase [Candidatus Cloacimonadota bacterium]MDD4147545.1 diguanylate cyclase [Candidatus Cloacimonadota bacterium]MDD4559893.1 diguanylate cyclase [Candidatus Cloacimonadota bacterium]